MSHKVKARLRELEELAAQAKKKSKKNTPQDATEPTYSESSGEAVSTDAPA